MKLLYCISNAFSNIYYKKSYVFRMIAGIVFISVVIQSSFLIQRVIQNYYNDTLYDKIINNAVAYSAEISENKEITEKDSEMLGILSNIKNTAVPVCSITLDPLKYINDTDHRYIKLSRTTIVIDNKKYKGKGKSTYNPGKYYSSVLSFNVDLNLSEYDTLDINTQKQFKYFYPDEKLFLYGGPAQQPGDIMINSYMISHYGIDNPDSIIGKTVTFLIDDTEYIKNIRIAGIINEKYFNMESTALKSGIIIYDTVKNIKDYCVGGEKVRFYVPIGNLLNNLDVYNEVQQLNNSKIICRESTLTGLSYTEKLSEVSRKILTVICESVVFAMILSIFSIIKTNIVASRNYYGMLSAIGMNRHSLFISFFSEHVLLILLSLIISFPFYELFALGLNKIISAMINDEIIITVSQLINIYALSSSLSFIVISLISCMAFFQSVSKNIADYLNQ